MDRQLQLFKLTKAPQARLSAAQWRALTVLTINPKPVAPIMTRTLRELLRMRMIVVTAYSPALYRVTPFGTAARLNGFAKKSKRRTS